MHAHEVRTGRRSEALKLALAEIEKILIGKMDDAKYGGVIIDINWQDGRIHRIEATTRETILVKPKGPSAN